MRAVSANITNPTSWHSQVSICLTFASAVSTRPRSRPRQPRAKASTLTRNSPLAVLWAVLCGDLLCDLEYMARPYELECGATDRVLAESVGCLEQAFLKRPRKSTRRKTILWFLTTGYFTRALRQVAARWAEIRLDRLRVKPKVKITGEFWMQVHEGDGNYGIKRWLEQEGAEVVPVPMAVWVDYLLHERKVRLEERKHFSPNFSRRQAGLWLLRRLYRRAYEGLRRRSL